MCLLILETGKTSPDERRQYGNENFKYAGSSPALTAVDTRFFSELLPPVPTTVLSAFLGRPILDCPMKSDGPM